MNLSFKKIVASAALFTFLFSCQPALPDQMLPIHVRKLVASFIIGPDKEGGDFGGRFESVTAGRFKIWMGSLQKSKPVSRASLARKAEVKKIELKSVAFTKNTKPVINSIAPMAPPASITAPPAVFIPQDNTSLRRQLVAVSEKSSYLKLALAAPNDPYYSSKGSLYSGYSQLDDLWGLKLLNAESAWQFTKGAGITVAVVDSGVYLNHPDLQGNAWVNLAEKNGLPGVDDDGNGFVDDVNGWDFSGNDNDPSDLNGHGTHVAGIIGALADNGKGIAGIAPQSHIMDVRVLNSFGGGAWSDVAKGVRYAAANGARVINLSLGQKASTMTSADIQLIQNAIEYADSRNAIVVVAAGNDYGDVGNEVPAKFDDVIAVGALRHQYDTFYGSGPLGKASFSNQGPQLDFMAPGVDILSLAVNSFTYAGYKKLTDGTSYYSVSDGTSMAAPMVSGAIALLLAENPLQTFADIYRRLKFSATDLGPAGFDNADGWGLINPFKALSEDYYDNGAIKSRFLPVPDLYEIVRKDYDISGNLTNQYDSSGNRASFEYYPVNLNVHRVAFYNAQSALVRTNEYYEDGVSIRSRSYPDGHVLEYSPTGGLEKEVFPNGDIAVFYISGNLNSFFQVQSGVTKIFLDENFYGINVENHGQGRLFREILSNGDFTQVDEYWPGTDKVKVVSKGSVHASVKWTRTFIRQLPNNGNSYAFPDFESDINGDGLNDIVLVENGYDPAHPDRGEIVVIFGGNDPQKTYDINSPLGLDGQNGFVIESPVSGIDSLLSYGTDINGDGYSDIVFRTAKTSFAPGDTSGATYVIFGKASGFNPALNVSDLNGINGFAVYDPRTNNSGGSYSYGADDLNGDQKKDLIFRFDDAAGDNFTYVVYGQSAATSPVLSLTELNGQNGYVIKAFRRSPSDYLSHTDYNFYYDVNGDGRRDIVATVTGYDSAHPNAIKVYVIYGAVVMPALIDLNTISLNGQNGFVIDGFSSQYFTEINGFYDYNGDGVNDIFIGPSKTNSTVQDGSTSAYVIFGSRQNTSAINVNNLDGINGFTIKSTSNTNGVEFSDAADINQDGLPDLILRLKEPSGTDDTKDIFIIYGKSSGYPAAIDTDSISGQDGFVVKTYPQIGSNTVETDLSVGDINGDSHNDLVITVRGYDANNPDAEKSYVLFSVENISHDIDVTNLSLNGHNGFVIEGALSKYLSQLSFFGDINGDGYQDLWLGTYSTGQADGSGSGYFIYGAANGFPSVIRVADLDGINGFKITEKSDSLSIFNSGDYNHDGYADFVIGAQHPGSFSPPDYFLKADYYVLYGQTKKFPAVLDLSADPRFADRYEYYLSGNEFRLTQETGEVTERFDENFYGNDVTGHGQGRVSRKLLANGMETNITEYWPVTDKIKIQRVNQSGIFQKTQEFYLSGSLYKETLSSGEITTYYEDGAIENHYDPVTGNTDSFSYYLSGNLKSSVIAGILEECLDENFYGNGADGHGRGRISRRLNADGSETRYLEYYLGTDKVKTAKFYQSGVFIKTLEYFSDGTTIAKLALSGGDIYWYYASGNRQKFFEVFSGNAYEYLDENFYGNDVYGFGRGRLSRKTDNRQNETRYLEYYPFTDKTKQAALYFEGNLLVTFDYAEDGVTVVRGVFPSGDTFEYYVSGNKKSFLSADSTSSVTFIDENFYGADSYGFGVGRILSARDNAGNETRYLEYFSATDKAKKTALYTANQLVEMIEYYDTGKIKTTQSYESGVLAKTTDYDTDGTTILRVALPNGDVFNYYSSGNLKNSLVGGVLEERLDENFYGLNPDGHGQGRLSRRVFPDGSEIRYIAYWGTTAKAKIVENYQSGVFLKRTEYYSNGASVFKITLSNGDVTEYYPHGNVKSVFTASDGKKVVYQYVSGSDSQVASMKIYVFGILRMTYTYAYDSHGRLSSLTRVEKDARGATAMVFDKTNIAYDSRGRVTSYTLTKKNLAGATLKTSKFSSFTYDSAGRLKSYLRTDSDSQGKALGRSSYANFVYGAASLVLSYNKTDYDARNRMTQTHSVKLYADGNAKSDRAIQSKVTYEFYDEDFYGDQTGRVSKKINANGSYTVYAEYWLGTDTVKTSMDYSSAGLLLGTHTFDSHGRKITAPQAANALAFGGDGYFEMLQKKDEERKTGSSSSPVTSLFVSPNSP